LPAMSDSDDRFQAGAGMGRWGSFTAGL